MCILILFFVFLFVCIDGVLGFAKVDVITVGRKCNRRNSGRGRNDLRVASGGDIAEPEAVEPFIVENGQEVPGVARYGGEEIVVVLPGLDNPSALALATAMRIALHGLALPHARSAHRIVTFSAGVATYLPGRSTGGWQTLVEAADSALYAAKTNGRDTVQNAAGRPVATGIQLAATAAH